MIPDSARIVASGDLLATEFDEELVVLNLRDGVYYSLEAVGRRIWQLLQDPVCVATLRDAILSEYDVHAARCEEDLRRFLGDLESRGLVEIVAGP